MTNEIKFDDLRYRRESEEFRPIRARLQAAVRSVEVPADLESRVRLALTESPRPVQHWSRTIMSIAAAIALVMGGFLTWEVGSVRRIATERQSYALAVSNKVATIMRVGLEQHIHCAVYRDPNKPADPPELNETNLGEYKELLPAVREHVPASFQLVTAHKCKFHGREFVHFTFRDAGRLLSLVIARKRDGESFETEGLLPALVQSGLPMYSAGVQHFRITGFETHRHLAYFVSNLPGTENVQIAQAVTPALYPML